MSQKYFKPLKKYVSRGMAVKKLKITPKQFDRLVVLCAIYPVFAPERNCLDRVKGWYYTIDDVKKIYYSNAYDVLHNNLYKEKKRDNYLKFNRLDKADCFTQEDYGLVELIKHQYPSLGDSISNVGESLRNLYIIYMLGIEDVKETLESWEAFVLEHRLLEKAFLSKKGVYFSFNVEKIEVVWSVPYPAEDFSKIIEEKNDMEKKIKTSGIKFMDFDSSSEYEDSEDEFIDHNDPNKLDVSLLKYAANMYAVHVKLIMHKLALLYGNGLNSRPGLFKGKKVSVLVKSAFKQLEFVLKNEEAELVPEYAAEIIIAECIDNIRDGVQYIQPQYIIDSLNRAALLDPELYKIGKKLPVHTSPFLDILESLDERILKTLSNTKKYRILDKIEKLN